MSTVRREIVLPVGRERAWELLTDPAELERWLADEVDLEPEPGARVRAAWSGGEVREGVVETVEPAERLTFRWWDDRTGGERRERVESAVEWRLEPLRRGTRVVVVERRLGAGPVAWGPRLSALAGLAVAVLA